MAIGDDVTFAGEGPFYSTINAMWPDLWKGRVAIAPPRNGMNRFTGKMLSGWPHVSQSIEILFETPFHQRVLRRWVGSFVPLILGESLVPRIVTRFVWAIMTAINLWEPGYRVRRVNFMGDALNAQQAPLSLEAAAAEIRVGHIIFRWDGVWFPRGHLGDFTPYETRGYALSSQRAGNL